MIYQETNEFELKAGSCYRINLFRRATVLKVDFMP